MGKTRHVKEFHNNPNQKEPEITESAEIPIPEPSVTGQDDYEYLEQAVEEWCGRKERPIVIEEPSFLDSFNSPLEKLRYILSNCHVMKMWGH